MKPFPHIKRRAMEFLNPMTLFPHPKKQPDLPMTSKSVKQYFLKCFQLCSGALQSAEILYKPA
jgi:hypothetical protein